MPKDTSALSPLVSGQDLPANLGGTNAKITDAFPNTNPTVANSTDQTGGKGTRTASAAAQNVLHWSVAIVLAAVVLLWLLGGIVFKNANL